MQRGNLHELGRCPRRRDDQGFEKWIELSSFQWGVGRGIGSAMSGQASRESSSPSVSEIVVTKRMDGSSPGLWMDAVAGQLSTTVKFEFTTTSQGATTSSSTTS